MSALSSAVGRPLAAAVAWRGGSTHTVGDRKRGPGSEEQWTKAGEFLFQKVVVETLTKKIPQTSVHTEARSMERRSPRA